MLSISIWAVDVPTVLKTTLSTIGLKKLRAQVGRNSRVLTIGVHEGATADVDDGNIKKSVPVAPYAAANEFGTPRIPQRPFLQNTMNAKAKAWNKFLASQLKQRKMNIRASLNALGYVAVGDVRATIKEGNFEPLKQKTIEAKERKGRPEPKAILIDTGSLMKSIEHQVE